MGSYGGWGTDRWLQVLYSAFKVPLLLLVTFGLALPSFFVLNTLAGLRDDFGEVVRGLIVTQAGVTLVLASFAPFTTVWYLSFEGYQAAILFNAAMFGTASLAGQAMLYTFYRPLIAKQPRHRWLLGIWWTTYAFVGIQMGWVLRPFVGDPGSPVTFFRPGSWGNAYEVILELLWNAINRLT